MAIKLYYNKTTYQLIGIDDNSESLVVGDDGGKELQFYFGTGASVGTFVNDATIPLNYLGRAVFKRADDESSNEIYLTPVLGTGGGYFKLILTGWFTDVEGNLEITTRLKVSDGDGGYVVDAFSVATLPIESGVTPTDDTITDAQYEALQDAVDSIIDGTTNIAYDNAISGLTAETVKDAIDELVDTKAEDDEVVHLTGAESVGGVKTFTDEFVLPSKSTEAENEATKPATEAQVYKLVNANMIKTVTREGTDLLKFVHYNNAESTAVTLAEFRTWLGNATTSVAGLMSETDKTRLDGLYAILNDTTDGGADSLVDTIEDVLAIFNAYPEGADLVTVLANKVETSTTINSKPLTSDIVLGASDIDLSDERDIETVILANEENISALDTRLDTVEPILYENEKRLDTLEEDLRKTVSGDTEATTNGEQVIHLGKDVANGPMRLQVDGMTLQASQLVTNGDFEDGTSGYTLTNMTYINVLEQDLFTSTAQYGFLTKSITSVSGDKYYINAVVKSFTNTVYLETLNPTDYKFHSGGGTFENLSLIITSNNMTLGIYITDNKVSDWSQFEIEQILSFNISTLISNKQYSPLFNTTFDLMSDANIKTQMDAWVTSGELPNDNIQSVSGNKRYKAVGKNLFDKSNIINGQSFGSDGRTFVSSLYFISDYIKVKYNVTYAFSTSGLLDANTRIVLYDINKTKISSRIIASTYLVNDTSVKYIRVSSVLSTVDTFQLEVGSTATTYEPYTSTEMYVQGVDALNRVPNLVRDTIEMRNGKFYHVKRVQEYELVSGDIVAIENLASSQIAYTGTSFKGWGDSYGPATNGLVYAKGWFPSSSADPSLITPPMFYVSSTERLGFSVPLATYASLAEAQSALAGTKILYQLATPIETEISSIGQLLGGSRYTVYMDDNIIAPQAVIYGTNAQIGDVAHPISALDTLIKLNPDGSQTKLSTSTGLTIAGDGLSFTHTSLTAGDIVIFTYFYANANSVVGNTAITYYDARNVLISPDGNAWKVVESVDNAGNITRTAVAI